MQKVGRKYKIIFKGRQKKLYAVALNKLRA